MEAHDAPQSGEVEGCTLPKHQRVPSRCDLPKDEAQVRAGEGPQASRCRRVLEAAREWRQITMADKPTREWLKPDVAALDAPDDARLTPAQSRAKSKAGEGAGYPLDNPEFYQIGPLKAKQPGIVSTSLISGR